MIGVTPNPYVPSYQGGRGLVSQPVTRGGVPAVPIVTAPPTKPELPPFFHPHNDLSLTFDFEPTMEAKAEKEKQKQLRIADPRYKTVVCVHWVNGLCMKGDKCEFLHEMDMDRMPECRLGQRCTEKMCPFKHVKDEERPLCNNYNMGFCQHGGTCRYQHRKKPQDQLPVICDFAQVQIGGIPGQNSSGSNNPSNTNFNTGTTSSNTAPPVSKNIGVHNRLNYRTAMCKSFTQTGTCSYGDNCDFAHSNEEMQANLKNKAQQQQLATAQKTGINVATGLGGNIIGGVIGVGGQTGVRRTLASDLDRIVLGLRDWKEDDNIDPAYQQPLYLPPPDEKLPDAEMGESFRYFVCRSNGFDCLAASFKYEKWTIQAQVELYIPLNQAFGMSKTVFLFFAVDEAECFAGVAKMISPFQPMNNSAPYLNNPANVPVMCGGVKWLRLCELSFKKTAYLTSVDPMVQRELPIAMAIECQELPPSIGHSLMTMLYKEESFEPNVESAEVCLEVHTPGPAKNVEEAFVTSPLKPVDLTAMLSSPPNTFPAGYLISIPTHQIFEECRSRGLFGLTVAEAREALEVIRVGTLIMIYTSYNSRLHGVFEAISGLERLWEAKAFLDPTGTCMLPMQFKFRVAVPCDFMHENAMSTLFHKRTGVYNGEEFQTLLNAFTIKTKRGDPSPPLKSPAIDAVERGLPPPLNVPKGLTIGEPYQVENNNNISWKLSCLVNMNFSEKFKAPNRLIGAQGKNMKTIQEKTGATRARVLAGHEGPADGVMEMVFEAPTKEIIFEALKLGKEYLEDVEKQWEEYQRKGLEMQKRSQALQAEKAAEKAAQHQQAFYSAPPPTTTTSTESGGQSDNISDSGGSLSQQQQQQMSYQPRGPRPDFRGGGNFIPRGPRGPRYGNFQGGFQQQQQGGAPQDQQGGFPQGQPGYQQGGGFQPRGFGYQNPRGGPPRPYQPRGYFNPQQQNQSSFQQQPPPNSSIPFSTQPPAPHIQQSPPSSNQTQQHQPPPSTTSSAPQQPKEDRKRTRSESREHGEDRRGGGRKRSRDSSSRRRDRSNGRGTKGNNDSGRTKKRG